MAAAWRGWVRLATILLALAWGLQSALAAEAKPRDAAAAGPSGYRELTLKGDRLARELSLATGIAVSPLLGMTVLSACRWFAAAESDRAGLPWHTSPRFWGPLAAVLSLLCVKDSSKVAIPKLLIVPLDALETLLEKNLSGLLALPFLFSLVWGGECDHLRLLTEAAGRSLLPLAVAGDASVAVPPPGFTALTTILVAITLTVIHCLVWVCGQACNILILLSPSSLLDTLLTVAKQALVALLLGLANTPIGPVLALIVVVLACRFFPRALRFVVFGTLLSSDLIMTRLVRRVRAIPASEEGLACFTAGRLAGLPPLTRGQLRLLDGAIELGHRPWWVLGERTVPIGLRPADCVLVEGLLMPSLARRGENGRPTQPVFRFRACHAGQGAQLAAVLGVRLADREPVASRWLEGLRWWLALVNGSGVARGGKD